MPYIPHLPQRCSYLDKAVDVVYTLIQSGKEFTLRPDVQPNREALDFSCIVVSVGAKYREYSTNITSKEILGVSRLL